MLSQQFTPQVCLWKMLFMSIFNRKIYNKTKERRFVEIAPETLGENEMVKTETVSFGINRRIGLQGVSIIPGIQQDAWVILSSKKRVMFMAAPENREYIYIYIKGWWIKQQVSFWKCILSATLLQIPRGSTLMIQMLTGMAGGCYIPIYVSISQGSKLCWAKQDLRTQHNRRDWHFFLENLWKHGNLCWGRSDFESCFIFLVNDSS